MRRENNKKKSRNSTQTWASIIGFLLAIMLLSVAIILSINTEKNDREAKLNNIEKNAIVHNQIKQASSDFSKTINEVKEKNEINEINNNTSVETNDENLIDENNDININGINENVNSENNDESNLNTKSETEVVNQFIKPVDGEITKPFSIDSLVYSETLQEWITHNGIDIAADKTTVVKAAGNGAVKSIKNDPRFGLSITIEHNDGFSTIYSSLLSSEFVKEGDNVEQGQSIGTIGNSAVFETLEGSHLHFELLKNGEYVNPEIYIK